MLANTAQALVLTHGGGSGHLQPKKPAVDDGFIAVLESMLGTMTTGSILNSVSSDAGGKKKADAGSKLQSVQQDSKVHGKGLTTVGLPLELTVNSHLNQDPSLGKEQKDQLKPEAMDSSGKGKSENSKHVEVADLDNLAKKIIESPGLELSGQNTHALSHPPHAAQGAVQSAVHSVVLSGNQVTIPEDSVMVQSSQSPVGSVVNDGKFAKETLSLRSIDGTSAPAMQQSGKESVKGIETGIVSDKDRHLSLNANFNNQVVMHNLVSNPPVVTSSLTGDKSHVHQTLNLNHSTWMNDVARLVNHASVQNDGSLQVKVHPEGMGDLLISVTHTQSGLQIQMESNQMVTAQWLSQQTEQMTNAVNQLGITVAGVEVAFGQANLSNSGYGQQGKKSGNTHGTVSVSPVDGSSTLKTASVNANPEADVAYRAGSSVSYRA